MTLGGLFDLDGLKESIAENEEKMADPDFWNDNQKAQEVIADNNQLKEKYDTFNNLDSAISDLGVMLELAQADPDDKDLQADME